MRLKRTWQVGGPFRAGGFGQILSAVSDTNEPAVIKLIPKAPGAERELLFSNPEGVPNVVPVWDTGEDSGFWVLVMPRAEQSLRDLLEERGGPLPIGETVSILTDIANALDGLLTRVVHRDLKPENVLLYQGAWCLADFGISRYAEASTAPDTRKHAMTPDYAAPERWRSEHATPATDVYALGIMVYEMLTGERPFHGSVEQLREQHLHDAPAALTNCPSLLAHLVTECLYKPATARPTPANIRLRLVSLNQLVCQGEQKLQDVTRQFGEQLSQAQARASADRSREERHSELFAVARDSLDAIREDLATRIRSSSSLSGQVYPFRLGTAALSFDLAKHNYAHNFKPFIVVASSASRVSIPRNRYEYEGREHSLWFCDAQTEGVFRWFETAFMNGITQRGIAPLAPFALEPGSNAQVALMPGIGQWAVAWPFTPIDQGSSEAFLERWIDWFATAAAGNLVHPPNMPERNPQGSWRMA